MAITGDIPAIAHMMGSARHMSYDGCRICDTKGVRMDGAMRFPDDGENVGRIKSMTGLTFGNVAFFVSDNFLWCTIFAMDEMHLIARGIFNLVFELVNPSVKKKFKGTHEIYIFTMNATI
ncbi:hypothetical protein G6F56_011381 [Rhizopus delemar]|nr:hypothetical protein G6F56_011381 [Rhizopus delemar]